MDNASQPVGSMLVSRSSAGEAAVRARVRVEGNSVRCDLMLCRSPPGVATAALELSLNAQQFTTARLQFLAYQPPGPSELLPPIGPAAGATSILVLGSNLSAHAQPTPPNARQNMPTSQYRRHLALRKHGAGSVYSLDTWRSGDGSGFSVGAQKPPKKGML